MKVGDKIRRLPKYQTGNWENECEEYEFKKDSILTVSKMEGNHPCIKEFINNKGNWYFDRFEVIESELQYEIY